VEPRVSLLPLGVSDLERAIAFYRDRLGWTKSDLGGDEVAFFQTGEVVIALFPRASFASDLLRAPWFLRGPRRLPVGGGVEPFPMDGDGSIELPN
jgi:catechol 2,3-dioxygenase-like lactoylglutathione lyase family enzyme